MLTHNIRGMSEKDSQNPSCPQFNMYDKSNVVGKYYNSMEYTNHNFQHVSSEGKNDENVEKSLSKVPLPPPIEIKLYKRRFLMLFLASFCSMMNGLPQFQFSVIADIVACYYGVSVNAADWTSIVYLAIFLPLVFPVMFLMDKKGLRYTVLGGGFLNCLASFCSMMNGLPQFQFSVIVDIVACYYGVSVNAADWTSIVYLAIFLPLVFPVMFLMDKKGLMYTVLGGGFLNCLASFCSMMNGLPQFQFSVIVDIVACYYGVSVNAADWTSIVYLAIFLPLVFPVMFLMDKKGLRYTVLGGGFLNCLGGWIQCAGLDPSRYIVIMVSQTIYAMGQVFLVSLPPFIAGAWFGAGEVGLATAFGVFGNQLGLAAGFIIPSLLIENNCTHQLNITHELTILSYPVAVINTVLFIALILVYQEKPKLFPSAAQAVKQSESIEANYIKSLKNLGKDVPYILLLIVYGLITGTYVCMSTILNQMVLIHFDNAEVDAGWMGAGMVFTGMAGSLLLGAVLDKTHRFKEISLFVCCSSFLLMVAYSLLIIMVTAMWVQFMFFGLLGFFLAGYLPVGLDFGAEITYPESEAMSASLLNASCQQELLKLVRKNKETIHRHYVGYIEKQCDDRWLVRFARYVEGKKFKWPERGDVSINDESIVITIISSALIEKYGDTASNIFLCACLLLATIITACIRCQLKRTNAGQCGTKE